MSNDIDNKTKVIEWFEDDFQKTAKNTAHVVRTEEGKVKYSFSACNESGLDFGEFSFKVKVTDRKNNEVIGTATIQAGEWRNGEKKNFKSQFAIPGDVQGISFLMYSESVRFKVAEKKKITTQYYNKNSSNTGSSAKNNNANYTDMKSIRTMNKMRQGKSGGAIALIVLGIFNLIAALDETGTTVELVEYLGLGVIFLVVGILMKRRSSSRAKRIKIYESMVNPNGNTSLYDLSVNAGISLQKVAEELQELTVKGFFPGAYVDKQNKLFVMTRNGKPIESVEASANENKKMRRKAARKNGELPSTIEDLVTMTDDADLKNKLLGLQMITKKIDKRVEAKPELEEQVKDFREKYYPEVVRLADGYNEKISILSKHTVDVSTGEESKSDIQIKCGEDNLSKQAQEIKVQLIKLIDSVTEASENLLERLHEGDIMDITTDIQMLQTTLASKGLLDSDFDL